jgi:hypothetical protein
VLAQSCVRVYDYWKELCQVVRVLACTSTELCQGVRVLAQNCVRLYVFWHRVVSGCTCTGTELC